MRESDQQKLERLAATENALCREAGRRLLIAGMDEVGRGPLAGPVVTACVCLDLDNLVPGVDDSKKLSEKKREALYPILMEKAVYARTAWVWQDEIDRVNILDATKMAMRQCAEGFRGDLILVDAVEGLALPCPSRSLIHGDALSYMIAAASVIAKVERDRYMIRADELYPGYGFKDNKGYGTKEHIQAIREKGPCPLHRRSFIGHFIGENA